MTLKELMTRQNLTVEDVATIGGVTTRSVRSWLSGASATPRSVLLILTALDEGKVGVGWLALTTVQLEVEKGA